MTLAPGELASFSQAHDVANLFTKEGTFDIGEAPLDTLQRDNEVVDAVRVAAHLPVTT